MSIPLTELRPGESATIERVEGGHGIQSRLEAMGVRPGKKLTKVSAVFMGGPVTVTLSGRQVAMGRGIARRVMMSSDSAPPPTE